MKGFLLLTWQADWPLLKEHFLSACQSMYGHGCDLSCWNFSYILAIAIELSLKNWHLDSSAPHINSRGRLGVFLKTLLLRFKMMQFSQPAWAHQPHLQLDMHLHIQMMWWWLVAADKRYLLHFHKWYLLHAMMPSSLGALQHRHHLCWMMLLCFSRESFGNRLVSMLFVPKNRVSFNFFPLLSKSICMKKPLCTPCILFGHSSRIHPCWSPFGWFSMGLRPHNGQPKSPVLMNNYQQNIQIFEHLKNFIWHNLISWQIFQVLSPKSANFGIFSEVVSGCDGKLLGPTCTSTNTLGVLGRSLDVWKNWMVPQWLANHK